MNARGILEIAKAAGQADIAPGYKVFIGGYILRKAGSLIWIPPTG
jgi:hypothetical protein